MVLSYNKTKYILIYHGKVICFEKFPDVYSAKVWALHNGYAQFRTINLKGDKEIVLKYVVFIEETK